MKKLFTLLSTVLVVGLNAQTEHTFTQYNNGDVWSDSTPLCSSDVAGEGVINHDSRLFDLASYGITSDFTLTQVDFVASATAGMTAWVEVGEVNGDYTAANIILGSGFGSIDFAEDTDAQWNSIEMMETQTFAGGSKFAVAIAYEFVNGGTRLWMGNNEEGESAPSYIGWPGTGCVGDDPTPVADLGFPVAWLFSVTGTTEDLGTVELGGKTLSIYPNPATDVVNVSLADGLQIQSIEVVNMVGQSVYSAKAANTINVSFLPAGVYVVRAKDNKGITHMSKVVVK